MCFKNSRRNTFANFFYQYLSGRALHRSTKRSLANSTLAIFYHAKQGAFGRYSHHSTKRPLANSTLAIFYHVKQGAPWRARHVVCKSNFSFRQKRSGKKWQGGHFLPPFRPSPIRLIPPAAVLKGLHGGVG
jgi:hypothetical protein